MRILSFHLFGKMAHFRKYYTNSSSMTYTVPPRTTVVGMIAGLLGIERDQYYEDFSLDSCKIAVANRAPLKKVVQKLNLLHIEGKDDLNGSKEYHAQTPTELVIPVNIRTDLLDYQIWFAHENQDIYEKVKELFSDDPLTYATYGGALALGTANHLGYIRYEGEMEGELVDESGEALIASILPVSAVIEIESDLTQSPIRLIKEELPIEFDRDRHLTERGKKDFIVNLHSGPVPVMAKTYVQLSNGETIMWME